MIFLFYLILLLLGVVWLFLKLLPLILRRFIQNHIRTVGRFRFAVERLDRVKLHLMGFRLLCIDIEGVGIAAITEDEDGHRDQSKPFRFDHVSANFLRFMAYILATHISVTVKSVQIDIQRNGVKGRVLMEKISVFSESQANGFNFGTVVQKVLISLSEQSSFASPMISFTAPSLSMFALLKFDRLTKLKDLFQHITLHLDTLEALSSLGGIHDLYQRMKPVQKKQSRTPLKIPNLLEIFPSLEIRCQSFLFVLKECAAGHSLRLSQSSLSFILNPMLQSALGSIEDTFLKVIGETSSNLLHVPKCFAELRFDDDVTQVLELCIASPLFSFTIAQTSMLHSSFESFSQLESYSSRNSSPLNDRTNSENLSVLAIELPSDSISEKGAFDFLWIPLKLIISVHGFGLAIKGETDDLNCKVNSLMVQITPMDPNMLFSQRVTVSMSVRGVSGMYCQNLIVSLNDFSGLVTIGLEKSSNAFLDTAEALLSVKVSHPEIHLSVEDIQGLHNIFNETVLGFISKRRRSLPLLKADKFASLSSRDVRKSARESYRNFLFLVKTEFDLEQLKASVSARNDQFSHVIRCHLNSLNALLLSYIDSEENLKENSMDAKFDTLLLSLGETAHQNVHSLSFDSPSNRTTLVQWRLRFHQVTSPSQRILLIDSSLSEMTANLSLQSMTSVYFLRNRIADLSPLSPSPVSATFVRDVISLNITIDHAVLDLSFPELPLCSLAFDHFVLQSDRRGILDIRNSVGSVAIGGSQIFNWIRMDLVIDRNILREGLEKFSAVSDADTGRVDVNFHSLGMIIGHDDRPGDFLEKMLMYLSALRIWRFGSSEVTKGLGLLNIKFNAGFFSLSIRDHPLEKCISVLRSAALSPRAFVAETLQRKELMLKMSDSMIMSKRGNNSLRRRGHVEGSFMDKLKSLHSKKLFVDAFKLETTNLTIAMTAEETFKTFPEILKFVYQNDPCADPPYLSSLCQGNMEKIDLNSFPLSALNECASQFAQLWIRRVDISCKKVQLSCRDLLFPIFKSDALKFEGLLSIGKLKGPETSNPVQLSNEISVVVKSSQIPQKIFADVSIYCDETDVFYGPSLDPIIGTISKCTQKLFPAVVPSKNALKWWDKIRHKFHGSLRFQMEGFRFHYLVTSNPNCLTGLEFESKQTQMDTSSGTIKLNGFSISVCQDQHVELKNSLAKDTFFHRLAKPFDGMPFHAFRVLKNANVSLNCSFDWICIGSQYDHYLHERPLSQLKSSALRFESSKLNGKIEVMLSPVGSEDLTFTLWSSDYKWFMLLFQSLRQPHFASKVSEMDISVLNGFQCGPKRSLKTFSSILGSIDLDISTTSTSFDWLYASRSLNILGCHSRFKCGSFKSLLVQKKSLKGRSWNVSGKSVVLDHLELSLLTSSPSSSLSLEMDWEMAVSQRNRNAFENDNTEMFFALEHLSYISSDSSQDHSGTLPQLKDNTQTRLTFPEHRRDRSESINSFLMEQFEPEVVPKDSATISETGSVGSVAISSVLEEKSVNSPQNHKFLPRHSNTRMSSDSDSYSLSDLGSLSPTAKSIHRNRSTEHLVHVTSLKLRWTTSLRRSFDAWWTYLYKWTSKEEKPLDTFDDKPQTMRSQSHTELTRLLLEEKQSIASSSSVTENDLCQYKSTFALEFVDPQINFQSQEAQGRVVLAAQKARLELGHFELPDFSGSDGKSILETVSDIEKGQVYKRKLSFSFENALVFVAPTGIDASQTSQWVQKGCFDRLRAKFDTFDRNCFEKEVQEASNLSGGLLDAVSAPLTLKFDFTYDAELPLISESTDTRSIELLYRLQHQATISALTKGERSRMCLDEKRVTNLLEVLGNRVIPTTQLSFLKVSRLRCVTTNRQFETIVDVISALLIQGVQREPSPIDFNVQFPSKEDCIDSVLDALEANVGALKLLKRLHADVKVAMRHVEYVVDAAEWVLRDESIPALKESRFDTENGKFLKIQLKGVRGVHEFFEDGSNSILEEVKYVSVTDLFEGKGVVVPEQTVWEESDPRSVMFKYISARSSPFGRDQVEKLRFLGAITVWDQVETKLFPVSIDMTQELYERIRKFFFTDDVEENDFFSKQKVVKDRSVKKNTSKGSKTNYFKFLRMNQVELCITFTGFINVNELQLIVDSFAVSSKLWSWGKVLSKVEKHVKGCIMREASSYIVNRTLGRRDDRKKDRNHKRTQSASRFAYFGGMIRPNALKRKEKRKNRNEQLSDKLKDIDEAGRERGGSLPFHH